MKSHDLQAGSGDLSAIEKLMAGALIAIVAFGIFQTATSGAAMFELTRQREMAARILEREMSDVRLRGVGAGANASAASQSSATLPDGFSCNRAVTIVQPGLEQVTLTVSWRGRNGRTYAHAGTLYAETGRSVAVAGL
jgi:hypothetical protein